jgi:hypothetical protein
MWTVSLYDVASLLPPAWTRDWITALLHSKRVEEWASNAQPDESVWNPFGRNALGSDAIRAAHLGEMFQLAREDQHVRCGPIHLEQRVVRHVEVHLRGMRLGRWEDRVEGPMTQHVPYQLGHRVFDFLARARLEFRIGLGLFGAVEELFAPEMEEDVNRREGDDDLIDREGAWVGEELDPLFEVGRSAYDNGGCECGSMTSRAMLLMVIWICSLWDYVGNRERRIDLAHLWQTELLLVQHCLRVRHMPTDHIPHTRHDDDARSRRVFHHPLQSRGDLVPKDVRGDL